MKQIFTIVLSAIIGALTALLFQKAIEKATPPRVSRPLKELSPLYHELAKDYADDSQLYEDHRKIWVKFVRQAVQADLTEQEASMVAEAIVNYEAPAYNFFPPLFSAHEKEEPDHES